MNDIRILISRFLAYLIAKSFETPCCLPTNSTICAKYKRGKRSMFKLFHHTHFVLRFHVSSELVQLFCLSLSCCSDVLF